MTNEATRRQHTAARPDVSTWLSANAGSGKTRVLTDRVARLLLDGVQPQHVLCLTYTKAAASEMQNRLFKTLGAWAMLDDDPLRDALLGLGAENTPTARELTRARTLFARAIETPGGLKIQTIHSFCAALLRRFPLEAEVSPQFAEMEDRAADLLRAEVLDQMADGPAAPLLQALARQYTGAEIGKLLKDIVSDTGQYRELSLDDAQALLGLTPGSTPAQVMQDAVGPEAQVTVSELIPHLLSKGGNDGKVGVVLQRITDWDERAFPILAEALLTQKNTIRAFPTKATQTAVPHLMPALDDLKQRVHDAKQTLLALDAAAATHTLHRFAFHYTERYAAAKQARGWLDYDDLIEKARGLLSDSAVSQWVLYRLDGGIDHILVDEAQDTSPAQWDVIRKLAQEFSSGEGARADVRRTLFVVGDKKQSIYSFQGADPREFDRMQAEFAERMQDGGRELVDETLDYSFRSSPAILRLVDLVFENTEGAGFDGRCTHYAFHEGMPGRVDLWPVVPQPDKVDDLPWYDPVDRPHPENAQRTLARAIARQIRQMLDDGVPIPDGDGARPVQPRDFLILVQKRSGIFPDLLRACKEPGIDLPIAGSDRLKVGAELAVRDLGALLSFLATPDDDLSLATALRSPLFGWSEQQLFTLAHHRTKEHLWQVLRDSADHTETVSILQDLRRRVGFLRPYDLLERILTRHHGRRNLLARLGAEAEDGINALLTQALSYERASVPSLTGFLTWMETDDLEIKRQVDSASNQIRVMTVHGAKGLEAPIVILPDCSKRKREFRGTVIHLDDTPVWAMGADERPAVIADRVEEIKDNQDAERLRLLYVALTRAEKWLIVAAAGEVDETGGTDWWSRVAAGMESSGATALETPVGQGLRQSHGDWPDTVTGMTPDDGLAPEPLDPLFERPAAKVPTPDEPLTPSTFEGAKALPGEGLPEDLAKAFGTCVHRLLEVLPGTRGDTYAGRRAHVLEDSDLPDDLRAMAGAEADAILSDPALAYVFGPETLAEAPFVARLGTRILRGTIDRLRITPDAVELFDFKTNRTVPATAAECPKGILAQMGAYVEALRQIYPERPIKLHILWTRTGTLMQLPHDIVTEALDLTPYLDVTTSAT